MKTLSLVSFAIFDRIVRRLPQIKKRTGFAFLVHPRDVPDVYRKYPFLKYFSHNFIESVLIRFWPIVLSKITGVEDNKTGKRIDGWVISIPITAEQMMSNRKLAKQFIIKACKLAEKKGAKIIGLGALTSSLTRGGLDLLPHTQAGITTGRIYTSKTVVDTVEQVVVKLGLNKNKIQIAIVGAAGSIGTACAQLLAKKKFGNILLVDLSDKNDRISKLVKNIKKIKKETNVIQANKIESINNSDIIIAVTNKPEALIRSENLKLGAVIVDDAQPSDVDSDVILNRKDVLVLEGGVVHAKGIDSHFNFGLKHKEDLFSCLAEAIILSTMGHKGDFQVGEMFELDNDVFDKIEKHSQKMGFKIGEFQNSHSTYSEKDISYVKDIIKKNN